MWIHSFKSYSYLQYDDRASKKVAKISDFIFENKPPGDGKSRTELILPKSFFDNNSITNHLQGHIRI